MPLGLASNEGLGLAVWVPRMVLVPLGRYRQFEAARPCQLVRATHLQSANTEHSSGKDGEHDVRADSLPWIRGCDHERFGPFDPSLIVTFTIEWLLPSALRLSPVGTCVLVLAVRSGLFKCWPNCGVWLRGLTFELRRDQRYCALPARCIMYHRRRAGKVQCRWASPRTRG